MLPNTDYDYENDEDELEGELDFSIETEPSLTYAMKFTDEENREDRFVGKVDETSAIEQAILKLINTERYGYEIYSWDYGIELNDLIGKQIPYVMSELKERITDAVTADDRIEMIEDFEITQIDRHVLLCTFTAVTVHGDEIDIESEVEV